MARDDGDSSAVEFEISDLRRETRRGGWDAVAGVRFFSPGARRTLALLGLALALLVAMTGATPRGPRPGWWGENPVGLAPEAFGMGCVADMAWDPTRLRVALLGCGQMGEAPMVAVLDVERRVWQRVDVTALGGQGGAFQHLAWSPDGRHLALTFAAEGRVGLALFTPEGVLARVFSAALPRADRVAARWDLERGEMRWVTLPRAAMYRWVGEELLAGPGGTADGDGAPGTIIGWPAGAEVFSAWQPGVLKVRESAAAQWVTLPFAAWSPSGRVLITPVSVAGTIRADGVEGARDSAELEARDAGLRAALRLGVPQHLAWRPDGKVLAGSDAGGQVRLFDTTTGALLATLHPLRLGSPVGVGAVSDAVLCWSAQGSHLLLLDARSGTITVWAWR